MFKSKSQFAVVVAVFFSLTLYALSPDKALNVAPKFTGLFRAFHVFIQIQFTRLADDSLQAFVVTWVAGIKTVLGASRLACGSGFNALELFLVLKHANDFQQRLWVIAGFVHVFCAQSVGF